jgi:hypothetical protein
LHPNPYETPIGIAGTEKHNRKLLRLRMLTFPVAAGTAAINAYVTSAEAGAFEHFTLLQLLVNKAFVLLWLGAFAASLILTFLIKFRWFRWLTLLAAALDILLIAYGLSKGEQLHWFQVHILVRLAFAIYLFLGSLHRSVRPGGQGEVGG